MTRLSGDSGDRGAGAVLVLSVAALLVLVATVGAALLGVAVARQRAAAVADLAALAAASHALEGEAAACAWASRLAAADGGRIRSCRLRGDVAEVVAQVRPAGAIGQLGAATSRARAGPSTAAAR